MSRLTRALHSSALGSALARTQLILSQLALHSIQTRGAYWELMQWLSDFLVEKFGEGGRTKQRWKLREWDESRKQSEERERRRRGVDGQVVGVVE